MLFMQYLKPVYKVLSNEIVDEDLLPFEEKWVRNIHLPPNDGWLT